MKMKKKSGRRIGVLFLCLSMVGSLVQGMSVAAYGGQDNEKVNTDVSHVVASRGGMPVVGEVKPLVVKVAFEDYPFESALSEESVYTDAELFNLFNGTEDVEKAAGDSLRGYYYTSSYGQLDIHCEKIYEYTAKHERSFYSELQTGQTGTSEQTGTSGQTRISDGAGMAVQDNRVEQTDAIAIFGESEYDNPDEEEYERPDCRLLDEMLQALDDEIDYRDYDGDGDGYIDAIYLNFAGPSGEWNSTWWPHVDVRRDSEAFDGVQYNVWAFIHNYADEITPGKQDLLVLVHETGHMLGIPDYYSYTGGDSNMLGTFDIMTSVEQGDHNGFTKWTYGWLDDDDIAYVDKEKGETTVYLTNLDTKEKEGKMIAVIAPENVRENGIYSRYFLVEYDAGTNLNEEVFEEYELTPGFRIFSVNAVLDEVTGRDYQKNNNYNKADRLIYDVRQTVFYSVTDTLYREGDRFAPDTQPASRFYSDNSKVGISTGIVLSDFVTGEQPSFKVNFTDVAEEEYEVVFTGDTEGVNNMLNLKLSANMPLDITDYMALGEAYLLDKEGNRYQVGMVEDTEEAGAFWFHYYALEPALKPNTAYTLVIPKDTFRVTETKNLEEVRIPVTTGDFLEEEPMKKEWITEWMEFNTDWIRCDDNTIVSLEGNASLVSQCFDVKLKKIAIDGSEAVTELTLPMVTDSNELSTSYIYTQAKLFCLEDGTFAAELFYLDRLVYYHIDREGHFIGEPQVAPVTRYDHVLTTGKYIKGVYYDRYEDCSYIFSIDFENPPVLIPCESFVEKIFGMGDGEYGKIAWSGDTFAIHLYNGEDTLTGMIPVEQIYSALTYVDDVFYYMDVRFEEDAQHIYLGKTDREGNTVEEIDITQYAEPLTNIWDYNLLEIQKWDKGLIVSGIVEHGYDKEKYVYFFDENMNYLGYRVFFAEGESFLLLKNDAVNVRSGYDITENQHYFLINRLFWEDGHQETPGEESGNVPAKDGSQGKQDSNKTDDQKASEENGDIGNAVKENPQEQKKSNGSKADITKNSSPKTGDERPVALYLLMGAAVLAVIAAGKGNSISALVMDKFG